MFAGREPFVIDQVGVVFLISHPECGAVGEADPKRGILQRGGGGAGQAAKAVFAGDVDVVNVDHEKSLRHGRRVCYIASRWVTWMTKSGV